MARLVIVPDERVEPLALSLRSRLPLIAKEVDATNLVHVMGEDGASLLDLLESSMKATHGERLLWALAVRSINGVWSSAAGADLPSADVDTGLVSTVFQLGQTSGQASGELQASAWTNLEDKRGRRIVQMVGAPVFLFARCVAVLTHVDFGVVAATSPLDHAHDVAATAAILGRLLEGRVLRATLGLKAP